MSVIAVRSDDVGRVTVAPIGLSEAHKVPFLVADLGPDVEPFMLHLYAALAEKERALIDLVAPEGGAGGRQGARGQARQPSARGGARADARRPQGGRRRLRP